MNILEKVINQTIQRKKLFAGLLASLIFFFLTWILSIVLPGGNTLSLTLESDHADQVQFYWWNGKNLAGFTEKNSSRSKGIEPHEKKVVQVRAFSHSLNRLRIDPGHLSGTFKIYELELTSYYSPPVKYSAEELYSLFTPGRDDVHIALEDGALLVTSDSDDPYIISREKLQQAGFFYRYVLPFIFSFLFYIFFLRSRFDLSKFAPFQEADNKNPSEGHNIKGLDGLRGLAALSVVADHSWGMFNGAGTTGVLIFFSLSGFLLAPAYIRDSSRALSWKYVTSFYMQRIRRILPMYYLVICVFFCINLRLDIAIRHFFLIQGENHFWAIPQGMLFCLLLPFIIIIIHLFFRGRLFPTLAFLFIALLSANFLLDQSVLSLYGMMQQEVRVYIGIFLGGMLFAYLYFSSWFQSLIDGNKGARLRVVCGNTGLFITLFLLLLSSNQLWGGETVYAQLYFGIYGFLAAMLVFCIAVARGTLLDRLMSMRWLRSIGVISLSFYLIHPLILRIIRGFFEQYCGIDLVDAPLFILTAIFSYLFAYLTYTAVEKPFHELPGKKRGREAIAGSRKKVALLAAATAFTLIYGLLGLVSPGGRSIILDVELSQLDSIQCYWWNGKDREKFTEKRSGRSRELIPSIRHQVMFNVHDQSINRLRIDTGNNSGAVKIYSLELTSHYAPSMVLQPAQIQKLFNPGRPDVTMELKEDHLLVTSLEDDPQIVSSKTIYHATYFYRFVIPFLFALMVYLFWSRSTFHWRQFPPLADIVSKAPSSGRNINGLDGLRGLAAISVVAGHTWGASLGTGQSGVWIFFALSGFLLAPPFIRDSSRGISGKYLVGYFGRRLKRILPMYYAYVFVVICLSVRWDVAIRHFLFLEGAGHLWYLPQEMFFYLLLPFLVAINYLLFRGRFLFIVPFILILMLLSNAYLDMETLALNGGTNHEVRAFVGLFLGGMMFSYLYFSPLMQKALSGEWKHIIGGLASFVGLSILAVFILFSSEALWGGGFLFSLEYWKAYGFLAAVLVFCVAVGQENLLGRVVGFKPFRAMGMVSLSLYLLHPLLIPIVRLLASLYGGANIIRGPILFLLVLLATYLVSCFTYIVVEKQFSG